MSKEKILVVDDEISQLYTLKNVFRNYDVCTFSIPSQALESIKSGIQYDILLIDFRMPKMSGREFLIEIKKYLSSYKTILITAFSDKDLLEYGINNSLFHRIMNKPIDLEKIVHLVEELALLLQKERSDTDYQSIIGQRITSLVNMHGQNKSILIHSSPLMQEVINTARKYAAYSTNVCIEGDSGTGKEVIANLIHTESSRANKPIIKVNCSAIPDNLFESEFFGYKKGAFTGANFDKLGKFQLANGGTLFLDEVGELPLYQQAKLLRVIEENEISPLGSVENDNIDVRIICATNKNLQDLVNKNLFRSDLMYRLKVLSLHIPSLNERCEDIPFLSSYFLSDFANKEGRLSKIFDRDALEYLSTINFPGNVRELRNFVNKLYVLTTDSTIKKIDVKLNFDGNKNNNKDIRNLLLSQSITLVELEKEYILAQLEKCDYIINDTARILGVEASNFSRKLKSMGISVGKMKKDSNN